jgi:hypothetical protein
LIQDAQGKLISFHIIFPMCDQLIQWIILGHYAPYLDIDVLGSVSWSKTKGYRSNTIGVSMGVSTTYGTEKILPHIDTI